MLRKSVNPIRGSVQCPHKKLLPQVNAIRQQANVIHDRGIEQPKPKSFGAEDRIQENESDENIRQGSKRHAQRNKDKTQSDLRQKKRQVGQRQDAKRCENKNDSPI